MPTEINPAGLEMTTIEATEYYGTQQKLAEALGIRQSAIAQWDKRPPMLRQYQIEVLTKGALKADTVPTQFS